MKTHKKSILYHIYTFSGVVNDDLDFNYGSGVSAHSGCGVTLRGQFWYLGGDGSMYNRQVNINAYLFQTEILISRRVR